LSDGVDLAEAKAQRKALGGADAKPVKNLRQGRLMHADREVAILGEER